MNLLWEVMETGLLRAGETRGLERHCPGDAMGGFCHSGPVSGLHTWVVITCQSWEGSPKMCWYLQKGSGIECICC